MSLLSLCAPFVLKIKDQMQSIRLKVTGCQAIVFPGGQGAVVDLISESVYVLAG